MHDQAHAEDDLNLNKKAKIIETGVDMRHKKIKLLVSIFLVFILLICCNYSCNYYMSSMLDKVIVL
jgi:hypothetical protein